MVIYSLTKNNNICIYIHAYINWPLGYWRVGDVIAEWTKRNKDVGTIIAPALMNLRSGFII